MHAEVALRDASGGVLILLLVRTFWPAESMLARYALTSPVVSNLHGTEFRGFEIAKTFGPAF
jgi:hypothetical protein